MVGVGVWAPLVAAVVRPSLVWLGPSLVVGQRLVVVVPWGGLGILRNLRKQEGCLGLLVQTGDPLLRGPLLRGPLLRNCLHCLHCLVLALGGQ